jgi:hypothetical protein
MDGKKEDYAGGARMRNGLWKVKRNVKQLSEETRRLQSQRKTG